jgi:hypothetical protein
MKYKHCLLLWAVGILPFTPTLGRAQSTQTSYYWLSGQRGTEQVFVIAVDSQTAAQIEAIFSEGGQPGFSGKIAAGAVDYNKDYAAPGHPVWDWHVTSVDNIFDFRTAGFLDCECPYLIDSPSDIAADPNAWIEKNGDAYTPRYYQIQHQITPGIIDAMANVSNRGVAGSGDRSLISGFIITGGEPRTVVVRALGPSLTSVQGAATDPAFTIYSNGNIVGGNSDWKKDQRSGELTQNYPSLAPSNDKEAAQLITLAPGAYTVQGNNQDGSEGVMLLEVYDVDSSTQSQ